MNAYSLKPIAILIEPLPVDPELEKLPSVMAFELCQRIIAGCVEAENPVPAPWSPAYSQVKFPPNSSVTVTTSIPIYVRY